DVNQTVSPSLDLSVRNNIFNYKFNANSRERLAKTGPNASSRDYQNSLNSAWKKDFWPNLQFRYDLSESFDDDSPQLTDTDSTTTGFTSDWDFKLFKVDYSLTTSENINNITESENRSENQNAGFNASRNFWDDRLTVGLSQQFSINTSEQVVMADASGQALIPLNPSLAYSGVDDSPTLSDLASTPTLVNDDTATMALEIATGDEMNIAIRVDSSQVDRIYLYTTDDITDAVAGQYTWALYSTDFFSPVDAWTLRRSAVAFTYDNTNKRFEFTVSSLKHNYLKLVATARPASTEEFTEIQAYTLITTSSNQPVTTDRKLTNSQTSLNLGMQLTEAMNLSYTASTSRDTTGNLASSSTSHSTTLNWVPDDTITTSFGSSQTDSYSSDSSLRTSRSYSWSLSADILPTLDMGTGLSRAESFTDSEKTSITDSFSIFADASLFKDLDSNLQLSASENTNLETNTTTASRDADLSLT
ncbi:MAG: hypothetical protein KAI75_09250, partial [Desulfobulbaceae bacterium]|nr:hypothetical protein [Desulfobulbaceae bacterium]